MRDMARSNGRLALLAAAALAVALLSLPATAYAHTATKISVSGPVVVDNSVPGTTPVAPTITAKLYRKVHGKWVAMSGRIRCYSVETSTGLLLPGAQMKTGSRVTFTLPARGQYVLSYSGSTTCKSCKAATARMDRVGAVAATPTISVTPVDATFSRVDLAYDVSWNTDVYAGPAVFMYAGLFSTDPEGMAPSIGTAGATIVMRYIDQPETVQFSYRIRTSQVVGSLLSLALVSAGGDRYIAPDPVDMTPYVYTP